MRFTTTLAPRHWLGCILLTLAWVASAPRPATAADPVARPNIVLLTADDMAWFSVGAFVGVTDPADSITPNLDRLAAEGMRFDRAYVNVAVCQASRSVMMTGLYSHRNGAEGFHHILPEVTPLTAILREAGYMNAILGKHDHLTPIERFCWDRIHERGTPKSDPADLGHGRNPERYYQHARSFIEETKAAGRPFFMMANSHDPHRPFYKGVGDGHTVNAARPSRVYTADEITVPGFLPDLPDVRRELAEYTSSARRADDSLGAVLRAIEDAGVADNTLIMFLSDNGISAPFAKTTCYLNGTRTPWIVRWPGRLAPGGIDATHFISAIDFMPTVLDVLGIEPPAGLDGNTFLPLLAGQPQNGRDFVYTQYHETSLGGRIPARTVMNAQYGYIWNIWHGTRLYNGEPMHGRTYPAMKEAADAGNEAVAARIRMLTERAREEFYDIANDPDCLNNLIDDPRYQQQINDFRHRLEQWMIQTEDPALEAFRRRDDAQFIAEFMKEQNRRSLEKPTPRNKRRAD